MEATVASSDMRADAKPGVETLVCPVPAGEIPKEGVVEPCRPPTLSESHSASHEPQQPDACKHEVTAGATKAPQPDEKVVVAESAVPLECDEDDGKQSDAHGSSHVKSTRRYVDAPKAVVIARRPPAPATQPTNGTTAGNEQEKCTLCASVPGHGEDLERPCPPASTLDSEERGGTAPDGMATAKHIRAAARAVPSTNGVPSLALAGAEGEVCRDTRPAASALRPVGNRATTPSTATSSVTPAQGGIHAPPEVILTEDGRRVHVERQQGTASHPSSTMGVNGGDSQTPKPAAATASRGVHSHLGMQAGGRYRLFLAESGGANGGATSTSLGADGVPGSRHLSTLHSAPRNNSGELSKLFLFPHGRRKHPVVALGASGETRSKSKGITAAPHGPVRKTSSATGPAQSEGPTARAEDVRLSSAPQRKAPLYTANGHLVRGVPGWGGGGSSSPPPPPSHSAGDARRVGEGVRTEVLPASSRTGVSSGLDKHSARSTAKQFRDPGRGVDDAKLRLAMTPVEKARERSKRLRKRIINVTLTKYPLIRTVASEFGFEIEETEEELERTEFNLIWSDTVLPLTRLVRLSSWQRSNHFASMHLLCRKGHLGITLGRMRRLLPTHFNFYPRTWSLRSERSQMQQFIASLRARKVQKVFIVKPNAGCQGKGIILTRDPLAAVDDPDNYIAQEYLTKPLLIEGKKFDLRVYALLTTIRQPSIFLFDDGLVRLCAEPYEKPNDHNMKNTCKHLTNYAINKHSDQFVFNTDAGRGDVGNKRNFAFFNQWLQENGKSVEKFWDRVGNLICKTILTAQPQIMHVYNSCFPRGNDGHTCFEILGFDILVDQNMKPWLMEVNHTPSLSTDTPLDFNIKHSLITETWKIIDIRGSDRRRHMEHEREQFVRRMHPMATARKKRGSSSQRSCSAAPSSSSASASLLTMDQLLSTTLLPPSSIGESAAFSSSKDLGDGRGPSGSLLGRPRVLSVLEEHRKCEDSKLEHFKRIYPSNNIDYQILYDAITATAHAMIAPLAGSTFTSTSANVPMTTMPGAQQQQQLLQQVERMKRNKQEGASNAPVAGSEGKPAPSASPQSVRAGGEDGAQHSVRMRNTSALPPSRANDFKKLEAEMQRGRQNGYDTGSRYSLVRSRATPKPSATAAEAAGEPPNQSVVTPAVTLAKSGDPRTPKFPRENVALDPSDTSTHGTHPQPGADDNGGDTEPFTRSPVLGKRTTATAPGAARGLRSLSLDGLDLLERSHPRKNSRSKSTRGGGSSLKPMAAPNSVRRRGLSEPHGSRGAGNAKKRGQHDESDTIREGLGSSQLRRCKSAAVHTSQRRSVESLVAGSAVVRANNAMGLGSAPASISLQRPSMEQLEELQRRLDEDAENEHPETELDDEFALE